MIEPRLFVSPISKNILDSLLEKSIRYPMGIIPSRNQIDFDGGYVEGWSTEFLFNYVKEKTSNVILCRDHGGKQNKNDVNDFYSLKTDCKFFDLIHVDAFKFFKSFDYSCAYTSDCIKMCLDLNPNLSFEVGTEEAVFKYDSQFLDMYLEKLFDLLSENEFSKIKYGVGQSGTLINLYAHKNNGIFDISKLIKFKDVCKKFNILLKEHNGDYLNTLTDIVPRFKNGLDAINIGPELAQIENKIYFDSISDNEELKEEYYKICLSCKLWSHWLDKEDIVEKSLIIKAFGHYVFNKLDDMQELGAAVKKQKEICKNNIHIKLAEILFAVYDREMFNKTIAFDLDDVICSRDLRTDTEDPTKYLQCRPNQNVINTINYLYKNNYKICIYTARGMNYFKENKLEIYNNVFNITKNQLNDWGLKYHQLVMGKIFYDLFIDDKAINSRDASLDNIIKILGTT